MKARQTFCTLYRLVACVLYFVLFIISKLPYEMCEITSSKQQEIPEVLIKLLPEL
jgi:hypothetical protein